MFFGENFSRLFCKTGYCREQIHKFSPTLNRSSNLLVIISFYFKKNRISVNFRLKVIYIRNSVKKSSENIMDKPHPPWGRKCKEKNKKKLSNVSLLATDVIDLPATQKSEKCLRNEIFLKSKKKKSKSRARLFQFLS